MPLSEQQEVLLPSDFGTLVLLSGGGGVNNLATAMHKHMYVRQYRWMHVAAQAMLCLAACTHIFVHHFEITHSGAGRTEVQQNLPSITVSVANLSGVVHRSPQIPSRGMHNHQNFCEERMNSKYPPPPPPNT